VVAQSDPIERLTLYNINLKQNNKKYIFLASDNFGQFLATGFYSLYVSYRVYQRFWQKPYKLNGYDYFCPLLTTFEGSNIFYYRWGGRGQGEIFAWAWNHTINSGYYRIFIISDNQSYFPKISEDFLAKDVFTEILNWTNTSLLKNDFENLYTFLGTIHCLLVSCKIWLDITNSFAVSFVLEQDCKKSIFFFIQ